MRGEQFGDVSQRVHDRFERLVFRVAQRPLARAFDQLLQIVHTDVTRLDGERHCVTPSRARKSGRSG